MPRGQLRAYAFNAWEHSQEGSEREDLAIKILKWLNEGLSVDGVLDRLFMMQTTVANQMMVEIMGGNHGY